MVTFKNVTIKLNFKMEWAREVEVVLFDCQFILVSFQNFGFWQDTKTNKTVKSHKSNRQNER